MSATHNWLMAFQIHAAGPGQADLQVVVRLGGGDEGPGLDAQQLSSRISRRTRLWLTAMPRRRSSTATRPVAIAAAMLEDDLVDGGCALPCLPRRGGAVGENDRTRRGSLPPAGTIGSIPRLPASASVPGQLPRCHCARAGNARAQSLDLSQAAFKKSTSRVFFQQRFLESGIFLAQTLAGVLGLLCCSRCRVSRQRYKSWREIPSSRHSSDTLGVSANRRSADSRNSLLNLRYAIHDSFAVPPFPANCHLLFVSLSGCSPRFFGWHRAWRQTLQAARVLPGGENKKGMTVKVRIFFIFCAT